MIANPTDPLPTVLARAGYQLSRGQYMRQNGRIIGRWTALMAVGAAGVLAGCGGGSSSEASAEVGAPLPQAGSWTWEQVLAAEPNSVRLMPLGDSITAGFGGPGGYRLPLQVMLDTAGVDRFDFVGSSTVNSEFVADPDHEGFGGWTLSDLVFHDGQGLEPTVSIEDRLLAHHPDIILLHAGTNDMFEPGTWQESSARLRDLLERIESFDPAITTLVAKIVPTMHDPTNLHVDWFNEHLHELVAERAAAGQDLALVDMQAACPELVSSDGSIVHPDFDCYIAMADAWATALVELGAEVAAPAPPIPVVEGVTATASGFAGLGSPDLAVTGVGLASGDFEDLHLAESGVDSAWNSEDFAVEADLSSITVPATVSLPYIQLSLPGPTDVRGLEIWNGRVEETVNGWKNRDSILRVQALTSDDGVTWTNHGQLPLVQGSDRLYSAPQRVTVDWDGVRFIRLEVVALHIPAPPAGETINARVSLSEIRVRGTAAQP